MSKADKRARAAIPKEYVDAFFLAIEQALFKGRVEEPVLDGLIEAARANTQMRRRLRLVLLQDKNMRSKMLRLWDALLALAPPEQLRLT